jgi:predicted Zn finger-like uncharacterized protein
MDVTCEKCRTEYEFDESLVSDSGTTVKCTNCGHLFRMYKPGTPETKRHTSWMLRQPDGSVYTFERMTTLQRWIAEGKASRWDQLSRTGDAWKALGEVAELAPFFEKADIVLASRDDEEWADDGPTMQKRHSRAPSRERSDPTMKGIGYEPPPPRPNPPAPNLTGKPTMPLPLVAAPPPRPGPLPRGRTSDAPAAHPPRAPAPPAPPGPPVRPPREPVGAVPARGGAASPRHELRPRPPGPAAKIVPLEPPLQPVVAAPPRVEPSHAPVAPAPPRVEPSHAPVAPAPPRVEAQVLRGAAGGAVHEAGAASGGEQTIPGSRVVEATGVPGSRQSGEWSEGALLQEQVPAWTEEKVGHSVSDREPAWTGQADLDAIDGMSEEDMSIPSRRRSRRIWMVAFVVILLAGGVAVVWYVQPEIVRELISEFVTSGEGGESSEAYLQGREYFLLDTPDAFAQADREYHRAGAANGLAQAGLAEVYTTWAQQLLDDVADSRLRAAGADAAKAPLYTARAELQQESYSRKLEQARRFVESALKHAPDQPEALRAAADYYRLTGDLDKAQTHIARALDAARGSATALPETDYVKALVDLASNGDANAAIERLEAVVQANGKLVRCRYRLARLQAAAGEKAAARESVDLVLSLSKEHEGGMLLSQALSKSLVVAVAAKLVAAEGPDAGPADAGTSDAGQADAGTAVATAPPDAPPGPATPPQPGEQPAGGDTAPAGEEGGSFDQLLERAGELQSRGSREACTIYRRADRARSGHPEVLVGLGYCALDDGQATTALNLFQRAGASYGPALIGMAEASQRAGSLRQAARYYRQYLEQHPTGGQASMARRNAERLEQQIGDSEPQPEGRPGGGEGGEPPAPPPTVITPDEAPDRPGSPENPTTIRVTEDHTPQEPRSDSLATDSEPPLRPGEDLD